MVTVRERWWDSQYQCVPFCRQHHCATRSLEGWLFGLTVAIERRSRGSPKSMFLLRRRLSVRDKFHTDSVTYNQTNKWGNRGDYTTTLAVAGHMTQGRKTKWTLWSSVILSFHSWFDWYLFVQSVHVWQVLERVWDYLVALLTLCCIF